MRNERRELLKAQFKLKPAISFLTKALPSNITILSGTKVFDEPSFTRPVRTVV